ncbi:MAG: hypothetical protein H6555_06810 [Lewinellaceae bacterium]|nr:hypothetical protein [Lewinellaceae bacterium]
MTTKKRKRKKKSAGINLTPFVIIVGLIGLALTFYIGYRASISDRKLFSVSLIALFAGLLFESFRVSGHWKTVIGIFIGAYFFSLTSFLPGKNERHYDFESHIEKWPYVFLFMFALIFGVIYQKRVTAKLTEGITLLLSVSMIYWVIDYGFLNFHHWFSISLIITGLLLSIFSIVHALTYIQLSKTNRLVLSIWSTAIMVVFAFDNIFRVFTNPAIENSSFLVDRLYIGLQYFFLGVSAIYILQNIMLLVAFLPSRNGNYRQELKETKEEHINRYATEQVSIRHSLFAIVFIGTVYGLNHQYQLLPRHTMIWLVFFTFPLISQLPKLINRRKKYR